MRQTVKTKVLDAAVASATSLKTNIKSFLYPTIVVTTSGTVDGTLVVQGALKDTADTYDIDFGAPASVTNPWFYVDVYPLNNSSSGPIVGSTGIALSTAGTTAYVINADELDEVAVTLTRTDGTFTVWIAGATNQ